MSCSYDLNFIRFLSKIHRYRLKYNYFMPVCGLVKTAAQVAGDSPRPRATVHRAVHGSEGSSIQYFMPVCGIVKTNALGAVDSSMHYCPRPEAECNGNRAVHGTEGSSFDHSTKLMLKHY